MTALFVFNFKAASDGAVLLKRVVIPISFFNLKAINLDFFQVIDKRQFEAIYPAFSEIGSYQCQFFGNLLGCHLHEVILYFDFNPLNMNLMHSHHLEQCLLYLFGLYPIKRCRQQKAMALDDFHPLLRRSLTPGKSDV